MTAGKGVGAVTRKRAPASPSRHRDKSEAPKAPTPPEGERDLLEALRGRLEAVLDDPATSPRDLAAVSREYRMTLARLAELAPVAAGSALDEIAARRKKRGA